MTARYTVVRIALTMCLAGCWTAGTSAQSIGTFRWQLQPDCNVVMLNISEQAGSVFTLDGFDDQCADAPRASVIGTAFLNPDATVGIGLNTVLSPGGTSMQVEARIDAVAPPRAAAQLLAGQFAIPVQPALDPVAFTLCVPEGPGATQTCDALGFPASYRVPAGKRLIIEQVAGSCGGDAEQDESTEAAIVARTAGVIVGHPISGSPLPSDSAIRIPLTLTRIYAEPHSLVTIDLTRVHGFNRYCWLRFSGQLVKP